MSERDLKRVEILAQVDDGHIGVTTAGHLMNMSRRHVYRLLDRFRSEGPGGVRHRARGRRPNNAIHPAKREYATTLVCDRRRRVANLHRREDLWAAVIGKFEAGWSPEQIAGRLKLEPKTKARVCHETIYRYVYSPEGQRQQLARLLPERRRKRRPRYARKPQNPGFPEARSIKYRPKIINDRKEFGHWEADLMIFQRSHGEANVATVV